ncbi:MAG: isoprenylcysteine carboxylmethyltransferase family protein [Alphaproteobacteria bacterium]|nr:isoprenylcysteine carboxylmethyltransferase family protein [Alphaproteobacteria bacterium]
MLMALIFVSAGTVHYWQAWLFIVVFTLCNIALTAYLWEYDQKLLSQRVYGGYWLEQERVQKIIMLTLSIISLFQVIVSALDYRLQSHRMATASVLSGDVLVVIGFLIMSLVFRVNGYASATIEITSDQKAISTGPYALVRHPMYAGGFLTLLGIPIALGSWWGVAVFAAMAPLFIFRLIHEEHFLCERLPGYKEYQTQVRWRLFPGIF